MPVISISTDLRSTRHSSPVHPLTEGGRATSPTLRIKTPLTWACSEIEHDVPVVTSITTEWWSHVMAHVMRHMVSSGSKRYNSHYGLNTCDAPPSGFRTEEASVCETSSGIRNTSSRFLRSPWPGGLRTYRHTSSSLIKPHRQSGCCRHHCFHFGVYQQGAVFHTARCCSKKHLNHSAAVPLLPLAQHRTCSTHTSWFNLPVSGPH